MNARVELLVSGRPRGVKRQRRGLGGALQFFCGEFLLFLSLRAVM
jgi:hypothetical protein